MSSGEHPPGDDVGKLGDAEVPGGLVDDVPVLDDPLPSLLSLLLDRA